MNYWQKQTIGTPLFPEIEWNKPERRDQAGKMGILGGSSLGFIAVADSYTVAKDTGAGEVRVLLPDALRKSVPSTMTDVVFGATTRSGGLAAEASTEVASLSSWADVMLLCGDAGKNSQTAILYEELVSSHQKPIVLTRDAVDLLQNSAEKMLENSSVTLVVSLAQLQRLFRTVYYPKMLTFSMQLNQLVETLHKFTITYPVSIVTLHSEQIIIASGGQVITQTWSDPLRIWRGHTAARAASYLLWTPKTPLKAIVVGIA